MKSVFRDIAVATVLVTFVGFASAATETKDAATDSAPTSCLRSPALISPEAVAAFKADTATLLSRHADGGVELVREVRGLVGSDVSTLEDILALLKPADSSKTPSERQMIAIGNGLAQAAQACVAASLQEPKALDLAAKIQLSILQSGIAVLVTAFNGGVGNTLTAALGGGGNVGGDAGAGGSTGGGAAGLGAGDGGPGGVVVGSETANAGGSSFGGGTGGGFSTASNGGNGTPSPTTP